MPSQSVQLWHQGIDTGDCCIQTTRCCILGNSWACDGIYKGNVVTQRLEEIYSINKNREIFGLDEIARALIDMIQIPTLDFSKFTCGSPSERIEVADALVRSLRAHGFVKLQNHGVPLEMVRSFQKWSEQFFSMSSAERIAISNLPGPHPQRGWSRVGIEQTAKLRSENFGGGNGEGLNDEREHFDAGPRNDQLYPNRWPSEEALPGFQEFIELGYEYCQQTALKIISALEVGLKLELGVFLDRCQPPASELRLNHYPPITTAVLDKGLIKRTWPHTDLGIITLLFQDSVGGLELEDRTGGKPRSFVPIIPNSTDDMIVNIADTFERWTNGDIRAALHQVNAPSNAAELGSNVMPRRYSTVFFLKADRNTSVGPLPHFITNTRPAAYEEMTALQYQQEKTNILHGQAYRRAI